MDGSNSIPPVNHSTNNNENAESNKPDLKSRNKTSISVVEEKAHTIELKKQDGDSEHSVSQAES